MEVMEVMQVMEGGIVWTLGFVRRLVRSDGGFEWLGN